ncbi:MAG TPA: 50S ribosomal protein L17, partial [Candidatus Acetothermia bacterium]|nr:50S ribosomal protein L17 [Candidatus Acetothermia bacterium]HEX32201.1 50S ribosomal protein L17 [Candidatus Acetothermia bacterium]
MRHRCDKDKMGMMHQHRKRVLANIATGLIMHGKVDTTLN